MSVPDEIAGELSPSAIDLQNLHEWQLAFFSAEDAL